MNRLEFHAWYGSAFHDHITRANEETLRAAYELGREAVDGGLSLLDLADVHHEALLDAIRVEGSEPEGVVRAAGQFLIESISAYEMVRRGFEEAHQAALVQRSRLEMLRRLSDILADTSLASADRESLEEVLRLIAEQARELIGARLCAVSLTAEGWPLRTSSYRVGNSEGVQEDQPNLATVSLQPHLQGRLAVALRSLDGRELGRVELFEKEEGDFTGVDEATLLHLSQIASAAVDRVLLLASRPTAT